MFATIQGTLFKASAEYFWLAGKSASPPPLLRLRRLHSWCIARWDIQPRCCYIELAWPVELVLKFNQRESLCGNAEFLAFLHFASLYKTQAFSWVVLLLHFKKKIKQKKKPSKWDYLKMQMSVVIRVGSMKQLKLGEDPVSSGFYRSVIWKVQ